MYLLTITINEIIKKTLNECYINPKIDIEEYFFRNEKKGSTLTLLIYCHCCCHSHCWLPLLHN